MFTCNSALVTSTKPRANDPAEPEMAPTEFELSDNYPNFAQR